MAETEEMSIRKVKGERSLLSRSSGGFRVVMICAAARRARPAAAPLAPFAC